MTIISQLRIRITLFCVYLFGGLECVGHSFAYVANFVFFLRDVWIRPQRAAVASSRATNLPSHPSSPLIRITLLRIRILVLIKVIGICDQWSIVPLGLHEPPDLYL